MLWLLPPMFLLWANLHGGFVAGLGVLLLWSIVNLRVSPPILLSFVVTLVNPYGIGLWTFLWRTLGPRPDIAEWQAIPLATAEGAAYLAVAIFGALALPGLARSRAWFALVLFVGGAMLPFVARRHLPLFVLITVIMCAEPVAALIRRVGRSRDRARAPASDRFRALVATAMVIYAMVLIVLAAPRLTSIRVDPAQFPIEATAWLAQSGISANLAVDFDWGEYVIWHAGPRVKVSVDGRRETVYSDAAYAQNLRFTGGADDWDRLLHEQPTDLALVSVRTPAYGLLAQRADWLLLMHDDTSALFGRTGGAATGILRATARPAIDPRRAARFP